MRTKLYPILLIAWGLLAGCDLFIKPKPPASKPEPTLPAETQTGANTFGCKVNGKVLIPGGCGGISLSAQFEQGFYGVHARGADHEIELCRSIRMTIDTSKGVGKYDFTENNNSAYRVYNQNGFLCEYGFILEKAEKPINGYVEITKIDHQKYFASGRFEFTLVRSGCDTIRVTEGRFDVKYGY